GHRREARVKAAGLLLALRKALRRAASPGKAKPMQAYMKSAMPYHGASALVARAVFREVLGSVELADERAWRAAVLALWRGARFREERYGALWLAGDRRACDFQTLDALPLYEEIIVTGAWWDYVDDVASHRLGPLLRAFPGPMRKTMLR